MSPIPTQSADRRQMRPERIDIGTDELVRNDLIAREQGVSERAVNRGDAKGAPLTYIAGVKYRPIKAYRQFLAAQIQVFSQTHQRQKHKKVLAGGLAYGAETSKPAA
jgi:hypothetical protein